LSSSPIEGIIIFADVDLQPNESEIDFSRNPLPPETKQAPDERV